MILNLLHSAGGAPSQGTPSWHWVQGYTCAGAPSGQGAGKRQCSPPGSAFLPKGPERGASRAPAGGGGDHRSRANTGAGDSPHGGELGALGRSSLGSLLPAPTSPSLRSSVQNDGLRHGDCRRRGTPFGRQTSPSTGVLAQRVQGGGLISTVCRRAMVRPA